MGRGILACGTAGGQGGRKQLIRKPGHRHLPTAGLAVERADHLIGQPRGVEVSWHGMKEDSRDTPGCSKPFNTGLPRVSGLSKVRVLLLPLCYPLELSEPQNRSGPCGTD